MPQSRTQVPTDDRAVSPVIGVILVVTITVVLAAVLGGFVLDVGNIAGQQAPQAWLGVNADERTNNVTIEHKGGDALHATDIKIVLEKGSESVTFEPTTSDAVLEVADTAIINITDPQSSFETIDWDGDGSEDYNSSSASISPLESGDRVTVKLIDIVHKRIIFETTVTV